MNIIQYRAPHFSPWSSLDRLSSVRELFDSAFPGGSVRGYANSRVAPLDVYEGEEKITVQLDVPGGKKEDFDLSLREDVLTVSVKNGAESDSPRRVDSFTRSLTLPSSVNPEGVSARYENGILTVTLPKTQKAKRIQIELN